VTLGPLVLFAPLLFENHNFRRTAMVYHGRADLCAIDQRRAHLRFFALAYGQHFEIDRGANFIFK
jgi:hypothetical protein